MYHDLEVALPADLNVNEKVLYFLTWGQMAYAVVGVAIAMLIANWFPLHPDHKVPVIMAILGLTALGAVIRPADRDLTVWFLVLLTFLRETHHFVWERSVDVATEWGGGVQTASSAYKPTIPFRTARRSATNGRVM
jgi:hypothetical protein